MSDKQLHLDDLAEMVTRCAGVPVTPAVLAADPAFAELGVDSLGVLGVVAEVENRLAVSLPDGADGLDRPSDLISLVNDRLARSA
ncbi:phosphopantetheine-binding protein [Micromonospora sp. NPDC049101]|uniref:phosphopantetheine-binding protein n=1 Tax=unclassified Micromonospora TaxID=2617518 RepID=UPI0033E69C9E